MLVLGYFGAPRSFGAPLDGLNRAEDLPESNPNGSMDSRRLETRPRRRPGNGADPWRPKEHADFPLREALAHPQPRGQGRVRRSPVSVLRRGRDY